MKIVVADDDRQILGALRIILSARSYDVVVAANGKQALEKVIDGHPDLVVLDLGMPELDGLEVIDAIRGWSTVPILVISGRADSAEKVEALDRGADDYVTKPFATDELLARIRALVRRTPASDEEPRVSFDDVVVDLGARRVTKDGHPVRLTPTEWQILSLLVRNPDRLVTREAILTEVWGPHHTSDSGYLRLYLAQLRKKLEPEPSSPRFLITESGMGYRFVPGGEQS
ncbi:response regulator transcription factor [Humibacter ginsenosidimutans]|uniref:Response regulator transcription factor n=1 Tax=Humibacter ginsenosidimutans TaxID=2599293 RepID=A0A5B8M1Q5_9MICO|nr:response regulator transcription factor [Humibacter ginsenosidimutans]QDZ13620.1 response regulator transcription factor [Humibacter ginsenosidimutans]